MEGVIEAAVQAGLPEDYVRSLGAWLPPSQASAPAPRQPKVRLLWSAPAGTIRKSR